MAGDGGNVSVGAILLAAGESTRMGHLKALLPWHGQPLLAYQAQQLVDSPVERTVVVLGHRAAELRALLPETPRVVAVENPAFRSGKVSSILAGLQALPPGWHALILGVDQPRPARLIAQAVAAHLRSGTLVTVAAHAGRRGHPVIFAPALRAELAAIDEATQGLRAVLQRHAAEVRLCETGSPLALVNLNTPADYEAARLLA